MKSNLTLKLKFAVCTLLGLLLAFTSNAQTTGHDSQNVWRLGIGLESCIPTSDMRQISHSEIGGTARLQYDIKGSVSLMLTSGYYNFFARGYVTRPDYAMVPVKVGVKAFVVPHAYVSGEAGAGFETKDYYGKNTRLILSPGIGYAANSGIDFGLRFESFSGYNNTYGMVAARIAYGFKL